MKWKIRITLLTVMVSDVIIQYYVSEDRMERTARTDSTETVIIAGMREETELTEKETKKEADGKASGKEKSEEMTEVSIRVLIRTDDYSGIFHTDPVISCDTDFRAETDESITVLKAGCEYRMGAEERVCLSPLEEKGQMIIRGLKRSQPQPCYGGSFELIRTEEGIVIINRLPLEDYLPSVVSSEMPSDCPSEALKAQAVCARTYALKKIRENDNFCYGADLDDSVSFQVYNNIETTPETLRAVEETRGMILVEENSSPPAPAEIYYYSTSCGVTTGDHFASEEAFHNFITSVRGTDMEAGQSWYRWKAEISAEKLAENLKKIWQESAGDDGICPDQTVSGTSGLPVMVEVLERKTNGQAERLRIVFEDGGEEVIDGEYKIRKVLAPDQGTLVLQDGSVCDSLNMLPSAWFVIESTGQQTFLLTGGGYGHGNGLSQNGACCMAEQGKSCGQILKFYYPDTKVDEEQRE